MSACESGGSEVGTYDVTGLWPGPDFLNFCFVSKLKAVWTAQPQKGRGLDMKLS